MKASIYSIYMDNVSRDVLKAQKECVENVLPKDWVFEQALVGGTHPDGLAAAVASSANDIVIFLDIDCIPLSQEALVYLAEHADKGILTGAVQRANHIDNNSHLYVGPFCMAFSKGLYKAYGSPSFNETARGDVAEELTYRWENRKQALCFLWPSAVDQPLWDLNFGFKFGLGTTYGTAMVSPYMFYHTFNARDSHMQQVFVTKCQEVLNQRRKTA